VYFKEGTVMLLGATRVKIGNCTPLHVIIKKKKNPLCLSIHNHGFENGTLRMTVMIVRILLRFFNSH
jgi:hypothetical protein